MAPMPSIQVKDVPDNVHAALRRRAAAAGQSLQEYLLELFKQEASQPTLDEILDRVSGHVGGRSGGSLSPETAARILREERDSR